MQLNAADKASTLGYLQTIKALEYLRVIETRDTAGAPLNVDVDPTAPVQPLRCKHDVLNYIAALLDSAADSLAAGGSSFRFALPSSFSVDASTTPQVWSLHKLTPISPRGAPQKCAPTYSKSRGSVKEDVA